MFWNNIPITVARMAQDFTLFAIAQSGRLAYETLLLAASLRASSPGVTLTVMEPQAGPLWSSDPRLPPDLRQALEEQGAEIMPFEAQVFGGNYPHGNKIEALTTLPAGRPFVFLDSDTLVLGDLREVPFDFDRPSASLRRTHSWPKGPNIHGVWQSLYDRFGLDFESSQDPSFDVGDWRRYLYFNAGVFYGRDPQIFGRVFLDMARSIRDDPPPELDGQALTPWLDQITLPLVIRKFGGGRDTLPEGYLDGAATCHYRTLPLLYAREASETVAFAEKLAADPKIKKRLKDYEPARKLIYQGKGRVIREMFEATPNALEEDMRKAIKSKGLWLR